MKKVSVTSKLTVPKKKPNETRAERKERHKIKHGNETKAERKERREQKHIDETKE